MSNGFPGLQLDRFLSIYSSNYYFDSWFKRKYLFDHVIFVMCNWWLSWLYQQDTRCFSTLFKGLVCQYSVITQKKSRKKILNFQSRLIYESVSLLVWKAICLFILSTKIYMFSLYCLYFAYSRPTCVFISCLMYQLPPLLLVVSHKYRPPSSYLCSSQ